MVSNISFGSTYKVLSQNNSIDKFCEFQGYASAQDYSDGVYTDLKVKADEKYPGRFNAAFTLVAPNSMDDEIEIFCANRGINFKKLNTESLLEPQAVLERIKEAPEGMIKVEVDSDKLIELMENQNQNIDYCHDVYHAYFEDDIDKMLKVGNKIPATTFYITSMGTDVEDTLEYINRFGADNLNDNQLFFAFSQRTNKPDHCLFFALKEMGINNIPVYVNEDTFRIASELGILK